MKSKEFAFIAMFFEATGGCTEESESCIDYILPQKSVPFGVVTSDFWQSLSVCLQRANARAIRERVTVPKALCLPVGTVESETDYVMTLKTLMSNSLGVACFSLEVSTLLPWQPTKSVKDYDKILARLNSVPKQAKEIVELLLEIWSPKSKSALWFGSVSPLSLSTASQR